MPSRDAGVAVEVRAVDGLVEVHSERRVAADAEVAVGAAGVDVDLGLHRVEDDAQLSVGVLRNRPLVELLDVTNRARGRRRILRLKEQLLVLRVRRLAPGLVVSRLLFRRFIRFFGCGEQPSERPQDSWPPASTDRCRRLVQASTDRCRRLAQASAVRRRPACLTRTREAQEDLPASADHPCCPEQSLDPAALCRA